MMILLAAAVVAAEDQDLDKQLTALAAANGAKDIAQITKLAKEVAASEKAKAGEPEDRMAAELSKSLSICKKDYDALETVIDALARLRSKKGLSSLKRIAFKKKVKDERLASVQAQALIAVGALADPKQLDGIEDQTKNRSITIARGAYLSLKPYGESKGKIRRRVAEILMKRMQAEYPRFQPGGKRVSKEKYARWGKLSSSIVSSLQSVCRQPLIVSPDDWDEWWRDNKKRTKVWRNDKEKK